MVVIRLPRFTPTTLLATPPRRLASSFSRGPAPPRLPKEEQERFERLQQESRGAFSSAGPSAGENSSSPTSSTPQKKGGDGGSFAAWRDKATTVDKEGNEARDQQRSSEADGQAGVGAEEEVVKSRSIETGTGAELHPHVRRGAKPEFEGETNPKTGEVGGPKNEPLRWGHAGDYSYNGRVTDF